MKLNIHAKTETNVYTTDAIEAAISTFKDSPRYDFINTLKEEALLNECLSAYEKFKTKKHFVQIGIGGSALGPEMLVSAINTTGVEFFFLNNIDTDHTFDILEKVDFDNAVFYIVSKSGGTAETMAQMAIVANKLESRGVNKDQLKDYFVFATDPVKSELKTLGQELGITTLSVPTNVGGRFSVLTPVGLFPALFAGYDCKLMLNNAHQFATSFIDTDNFKDITKTVLNLYEDGVNQTVLMPYSSKLRDLSFWFVQLWAESLGKIRNGTSIGLTPIPSYGATDQHSQMQLFMEGPKDKLMFMLNIKENKHQITLANDFKNSKLEILKKYNLKNLMDSEFFGTLKALEEQGAFYTQIEIDSINESSIGELILFFELLTAITGICLNIDPFDQPGVEAGKVYSFEWLSASL